MNLIFNILWIEDQKKNVRGQESRIRAYLQTKHIDLYVTWHENFTDGGRASLLRSVADHNEYDLILVDYDLGSNNAQGDVLAREIRCKTHNELVFYGGGSKKNLREKIFNQNIDGVFVISRDRLGVEITGVIDAILRRFERFNPLRGLFMAEVSNFDLIMADIITKRYEQVDDEGKAAIMDSICGRFKTHGESLLEKVKSLRDLEIKKIVDDSSFGVYQKFKLIEEWLSQIDNVYIRSIKETFSKFQVEVNEYRIALAHAQEKTNDNGAKHIINRSGEEITLPRCPELRCALVKHKRNLEQLLEFVLQGGLDD